MSEYYNLGLQQLNYIKVVKQNQWKRSLYGIRDSIQYY